MDPQAKNGSSPAAKEGFAGRLSSLGADGGGGVGSGGGGGGDSESGAASDEATVGCCSDTFGGSLADMEQETLEEKLRGLAFRKQTSYR